MNCPKCGKKLVEKSLSSLDVCINPDIRVEQIYTISGVMPEKLIAIIKRRYVCISDCRLEVVVSERKDYALNECKE